jgi:hypothetical protein
MMRQELEYIRRGDLGWVLTGHREERLQIEGHPPTACSVGTVPPRTPDTSPQAARPGDNRPGQTPTRNAQDTGSCSFQHHPGPASENTEATRITGVLSDRDLYDLSRLASSRFVRLGSAPPVLSRPAADRCRRCPGGDLAPLDVLGQLRLGGEGSRSCSLRSPQRARRKSLSPAAIPPGAASRERAVRSGRSRTAHTGSRPARETPRAGEPDLYASVPDHRPSPHARTTPRARARS